jgi:hypothetical protein
MTKSVVPLQRTKCKLLYSLRKKGNVWKEKYVNKIKYSGNLSEVNMNFINALRIRQMKLLLNEIFGVFQKYNNWITIFILEPSSNLFRSNYFLKRRVVAQVLNKTFKRN